MNLEFIPLKQTKRGKPTILFSKTGLISLSKTAAEEIGLTKETRIELARDADRSEDWYLVKYRPGVDAGVPFRQKDNGLCLNASSWTHAFLDQFSEGRKSLSVLIATQPEDNSLGGKAEIFAILTKSLR
ncbi:hypothetical protein [Cyclobacterium sp.]|uniref:hypothetical protein n=1 Tax=Cyclobacterium sp. TaxID=1966343 RepID=UPI0019A37AB3|nr:hypothetical protein [Cyclobacterium sp.]MBD3630496.1 hypothetical protein [Cyclobacterium sp.]